MRITNTQDYFTNRRTQLRVERYLSRLHQQPITHFLPISDPFNGALKRPTQKVNS